MDTDGFHGDMFSGGFGEFQPAKRAQAQNYLYLTKTYFPVPIKYKAKAKAAT